MPSCWKSNLVFVVSLGLLGMLSLGCQNATGRPVDPGKPIVIQFHYDGAPITEGSVDLSGVGGGTTLTAEGEAVFRHVPFGTYQVVVLPKQDMSDVIPPEAPPTGQTSSQPKPKPTSIPRKFRDEQTTPLQIEVSEDGSDRFEFELKMM